MHAGRPKAGASAPASHGQKQGGRLRWPAWCLLSLLVLTGMVCGLGAWGLRQRSPQELIRYAQHRLIGHPRLQTRMVPLLTAIQVRYEHPLPKGSLPHFGKGQQMSPVAVEPLLNALMVNTADQLRAALQSAPPGTHIRLAPGRYLVSQTLYLGHAGTEKQPITLYAPEPASTTLVFSQVEGFLVDKPYWQFLNLHIVGACKSDSDCEHAFHVVGHGRHFLLRNSLIEDFNADIKVNGVNGVFPDGGEVLNSTLHNKHPRRTSTPVTAIDLVGASDWRVTDNLIANTIKADGDQVSYAAFMKGGGHGGRFERNLVICSESEISRSGERIGLSFGGGLTDPDVCSNDRCQSTEFAGGIMANNIVAHCNDVGIDINHATQATLAFNTLVNTAGILLRGGPQSSAKAYGNLFDGNFFVRQSAQLSDSDGQTRSLSHWFVDPDRLNFARLMELPTAPTLRATPSDFCGLKRAQNSALGALDTVSTCP